MTTRTQRTIQEVKDMIPFDFAIRAGRGELKPGRVRGRSLAYARVSYPAYAPIELQCTISVSWVTLARAMNAGRPIMA